MTIWDTLTGRKSSASSNSSSTPSSSAPTFATPDSSNSSSPFIPDSIDSSTPPQLPSFLSDPSLLHPLSNISEASLDYLTLDDSALSDLPGSKSALPSRGWSDDLCYGTGCTYLTALTIGGALGFTEGVRNIPQGAPPKIRLNAILNGVTRRGPFLGNSAGVIAMLYNGINSYIGYLRGKHDATNSIAAGAISGMVFRSTKGTKPMMISGALVGTAAGVWAYGRRVLFPDE